MKYDGLFCGLIFYYISPSGKHLKQFMETLTGINQLLRNLCHNSVWSYAILWKLQETTQMLLACDDAYFSATKSHVTMEYAPCTGFHSSDPVVTTCGCETNALIGDIPDCSMEAMVSNISRYRYFLGIGIVGITASSEKHKWISLFDLNSNLLLGYPEELQLQAAAGIKTILLVPVLPLGVVQLGSFYELHEDLKMVAQMKDLFLKYQYALELQSTFGLETDNDAAVGRPMIHKYSACFATADELTDPSNFKTVAMQDWMNLNDCDEVIEDQQPNDPLPQDGLGTNSSEQIFWDTMCNELLSDCSIEQVVINASANAVSTLAADQSILSYSYRDGEIDMIPVITNCLAPEDPIMSDNEFSYDEAWLGFREEFDVVMDSITDGIFSNFPSEPIQPSSLFEFHETAWVAEQSEANELTNTMSIFEAEEVPKPVEEPAAIVKDLESSGYHNSSITQCKDGDLMGSEVSIPGTNTRMPSLISNIEGFASHLTTTVQNNSVNTPPSNEDPQDMEEELHEVGSSKQGKRRGCRGPRPRDRQLIQDRITELRELIPNGSKCSIYVLLERAVKHMMFLESVPAHADKLNKSNTTKVGKGSRIHEKPFCRNESSFESELETKRNNLPVIIENVEQQPDQMLIEIQCRDCGLFLDAAQAFKRLNLTILEGTLQSRSTEQQWAHFILQVPEEFNRMEILWPIMRLLQFEI